MDAGNGGQEMSDTPETQAESFEYDQQCSPVVDAEFAARLERERDETRKDLQDLRDKMYDVLDELERIKWDIQKAIR
jgi:predicted  nucleic acid-binding Zn-ribbon protein